MYNLLVAYDSSDWDNGFYAFDKSRFLEYTNKEIASALKDLSPTHISNLISYPCLFASEDKESDARIGYITSIRERGRELIIEFEFDSEIEPIPFSKIAPLSILLDIRDWEMNRVHWAVKSEDLIETLQRRGVISQKISEKKLEKPTIEVGKSQAVTQLQAFIAQVLKNKKENKFEVFYRGHSNKSKYKLEPSLFRKDEDGNYLYRNKEDLLFKELLVSNSIDFQSDVSTLDSLVRMQHYSLPTRLLDITSNPLIALYFACKSAQNDEGEVIVFSIKREQIKYFDSDTASCIANLARLPQSEKEKIQFNDHNNFNNQLPIKRLLHLVNQEKPFFEPRIQPDDLRKIILIKGKHSNDRISSQSGAFLLFGLDSIFDENGTNEIHVNRISIKNKKYILEELDLLNINESTVFPYIENSAKYIAEKLKFVKPNP